MAQPSAFPVMQVRCAARQHCSQTALHIEQLTALSAKSVRLHANN